MMARHFSTKPVNRVDFNGYRSERYYYTRQMYNDWQENATPYNYAKNLRQKSKGFDVVAWALGGIVSGLAVIKLTKVAIAVAPPVIVAKTVIPSKVYVPIIELISPAITGATDIVYDTSIGDIATGITDYMGDMVIAFTHPIYNAQCWLRMAGVGMYETFVPHSAELEAHTQRQTTQDWSKRFGSL